LSRFPGYCSNRSDLVEFTKRGCGVAFADNGHEISLIIPVVLPDSYCAESKFANEGVDNVFKSKDIENESINFPVKPEALVKSLHYKIL